MNNSIARKKEMAWLKVKDNTITGKDFSITFAEDGTTPTRTTLRTTAANFL